MRRSVHSWHALCAFGVCTAWSDLTFAQEETKQRCLLAYEDAQVLTREGSLIEARERLQFCSSSQCPEVMHGDCARWLDEVEVSIPTVVFRLKDASGSATVSIDGADPVPLDGQAVSVNPGQHALTFATSDGRSVSRVLVFSEGEKLRHEVVHLDPSPERHIYPPMSRNHSTPPADPAGFSVTLPMILASSVAVAGGAGFTYFGLTARSRDRELDQCIPNCTQESVDTVRTDYALANLSLGVGAAGLVTTVVLVLLESSGTETRNSSYIWLTSPPVARGLSVAGSF